MTEQSDVPRERCICGKWPRFGCYQSAEDYVTSFYTCVATPIPGGGATGCGRSGPQCEDNFADRGTAAMLWDRSIREERRRPA